MTSIPGAGSPDSGDPVDAVVVGSGPNGLTAAAILSRAGYSVHVIEAASTIGGGTRSEELTLPGVLHDVCSAVHPFGVASAALAALPLTDHGLTWRWPEIDVVHPIDGGRAGVLYRSLDETARGMEADGRSWRRLFEPLAQQAPELSSELFGPLLHLPRHPLLLARFGLSAVLPASAVVRRWDRPETRALFGGIAAHAMRPLTHPLTGAIGVTFCAVGHHTGWPVAEGGSRAITDALAAVICSGGGTIETGRTVTSFDDLPPHRVALFDVSPQALDRIAGDRLPSRVAKAYRKYRYGPAAFKVDLAVEGGIPWTAEPVRRAGTVHLGGTFEEVASAEAEVSRGRMPERPFVLLAQQYLADPGRSAGSIHPVWTYAHVPHGWTGDATKAILDQLERFAPGTRDRIVATAVRDPHRLQADNANYMGGDIATGANDPLQMVFRPRVSLDPYATGIPGVYLCSAATPPGAGVHGMAGHHAAQRALRDLNR
ncbi:MAG: NAD(P)/FAD-dependent oxidoreductase [Aquihabitans sp.]